MASNPIFGTKSRSWVSPITAVSFIVLSITGMFMLFHVRIPGFHVLHEMMGILFCVMGIYHLILNWKPLVNYCTSRTGIVALTATALVGALLLAGGVSHDREEGMPGGHHGRGGPAGFVE